MTSSWPGRKLSNPKTSRRTAWGVVGIDMTAKLTGWGGAGGCLFGAEWHIDHPPHHRGRERAPGPDLHANAPKTLDGFWAADFGESRTCFGSPPQPPSPAL